MSKTKIPIVVRSPVCSFGPRGTVLLPGQIVFICAPVARTKLGVAFEEKCKARIVFSRRPSQAAWPVEVVNNNFWVEYRERENGNRGSVLSALCKFLKESFNLQPGADWLPLWVRVEYVK